MESRSGDPANAPEAQELPLEEERDLSFVNRGGRAIQLDEQAPRIAIEIPLNWKALQDADLQAALAWRDATDEILQAYLGHEDGRYMITDTGKRDGRCYLVARRIGADFPPPVPEL